MLGPWYTEHEGGQGLGEVCQESWVVEEGGDGAEHTFKVWWIATLFIGFFTHLLFETVPEAPKGCVGNFLLFPTQEVHGRNRTLRLNKKNREGASNQILVRPGR